MKSIVLLISVCLINLINCSPVKIEPKSLGDLDPVELTAKLLIELDEKIELGLENKDANSTVAIKYPQLYIPPNESEIALAKEEKFSDVLKDLSLLEANLEEEIRKATAKRQFADAARLRPLLTYVRYIRRNMDLLRNRFVAIATVTSIAATVNEVVDRFSDVMTSSAPGVVLPESNQGIIQPIRTAFTFNTTSSTTPEKTDKNNQTKPDIEPAIPEIITF